MNKKILSAFIALLLLVGGCCIPVSAGGYDGPQIENGITSGIFTYTLSEGKATLARCDIEASGEIIVPSDFDGYPVVSIGESAFYDCEKVTSIVLPDTVETIETLGFYGAWYVKKIDLGKGLKKICAEAFADCGIKELFIPKTVVELEETDYANFFSGNNFNSLEKITVEEGNPIYKSSGNCLIDINNKKIILGCRNSVIPDDGSAETIGVSAFADLLGVETIVIPQSIKKIEKYVFCLSDVLKIEFINSELEFDEDAIQINGEFIFKCYKDSTAHKYAVANDIPVQLIDEQNKKDEKPVITEGKDTSYNKGTKTDLVIKSNANFKDFEAVLVDGIEIDKKNYTVKEGSTIVTLKADYLATLKAGRHTVGIKSTTGTAETTLTVENENAAQSGKAVSPKTGDNGVSAVVVMLMTITILGGAVAGKKLFD